MNAALHPRQSQGLAGARSEGRRNASRAWQLPHCSIAEVSPVVGVIDSILSLTSDNRPISG